MPWNYATDPLYRALLAEVADLEWQCVEDDFLRSLRAADAPDAAGTRD